LNIDFEQYTFSTQVMTASDDSAVRIWKLHTRKPDPYQVSLIELAEPVGHLQVEWRFSESIQNAALVGAQFSNGRGSAFLVTAADFSKLFLFKIAKKTSGI
jgi:hypothetical protein